LAGVLVEMSLHTRHAALLLAGAVAFGLLAVTARGPLGVARVCGGRVHAALDVAVALALAAAPILPVLRPGILGVVAVEVVAVMWLRVATLTRFLPTVGRAPATGPTAAVTSPDRRGEVAVRPGSAVARTLGLFAGRAVRRLPDPPEDLADDLAERARQAGRRFHRVQRAWQARSRP
jgi:hypothetical protein